MGYTLTIGNAVPRPPDPADGDEGTFGWGVASATHPDAPAGVNDANPRANYRWPSYSTWSDFARAVGLYELFFDKEIGLIRAHPGIVPLLPKHRTEIDAALARWRAMHPDAVPRFADPLPGHPFGVVPHPMNGPNATLARLEWLAWWVGWALDNCEHPAFENT